MVVFLIPFVISIIVNGTVLQLLSLLAADFPSLRQASAASLKFEHILLNEIINK